MAAEDAMLQKFLLKTVGPCLMIVCCVYYFRAILKRHIYDRVFTWVLNRQEKRVNKALEKENKTVFEQLSILKTRLHRNISVLEIGAGSAPNRHLFPKDTEVICLEPNPHFNQYIETNLKKSFTKVTVSVMQGYAEKIPEDDARFDAVVCTFVLCSVHDPVKSLKSCEF